MCCSETIKLQFGKDRHTLQLLCILVLFTNTVNQLSFKNAWLPPIFFLDCTTVKICFSSIFIHRAKIPFELVGTILSKQELKSTVTVHSFPPLLPNAERALLATAFLLRINVCWRLPHPNRGRRPFNYIDVIGRDIQLERKDLPNFMSDKAFWQRSLNSIKVATA